MEQYIRLSHSALASFLTCERMFQLDRLLEGAPEKRDYPATVFGKAFGAGVAEYMLTQDKEIALFKAYLAYTPVLEDDKRTEEILINMLLVAFPKLDTLLLDYEVAVFEGKPAIELSFRLNCTPTIFFVGYVDMILRNKWTGVYAIVENKSTGMNLLDLDPLFKNSGQALGYSIILDRIAGKDKSAYEVIYPIGQLNSRSNGGFSPNFIIKTFNKTLKDRLNWFITLKMDIQRLEQMQALSVFPMRGNNCLQYMRPCKHFGTCGMQGLDKPKELPPDLTEYQFTYSLDELVAEYLERME